MHTSNVYFLLVFNSSGIHFSHCFLCGFPQFELSDSISYPTTHISINFGSIAILTAMHLQYSVVSL